MEAPSRGILPVVLAVGCSPPLVRPPRLPISPLSAVSDVSVTVYRAPNGQHRVRSTWIALDGFALVSETRTVSIPAGESRIRFEGVADGIDAASVIITGLPDGVLEKSRDARLLSPSALVAGDSRPDSDVGADEPRYRQQRPRLTEPCARTPMALYSRVRMAPRRCDAPDCPKLRVRRFGVMRH